MQKGGFCEWGLSKEGISFGVWEKNFRTIEGIWQKVDGKIFDLPFFAYLCLH